jgi:hypothetical protein
MIVDCVAIVTLLNEHSWREENCVITALRNVCVLILGDKISDSSVYVLQPGIQSTSNLEDSPACDG